SRAQIPLECNDIARPQGGGEIVAKAGRGLVVPQEPMQSAAHLYSAASLILAGVSGNRQITVVPPSLPVLISTVPPCSSTKLLTTDRPRPAPRRRPPLERGSKRLKMVSSTSGAMPGPS